MAEKDDAVHRQLEELIVEAAHCDWFSSPGNVAEALLAAGWRPPLPEGASGHPLGLDELVSLMLRKARDEQWADERCSKAGRALATRVEAGDFDDEDEPSPLPDSETEHVVEFREDGWTIKHPLACRPNLFDCAVNRAAGRALQEPPAEFGRFACGLAEDGQFVVGDRRGVTS
jgi:hypothetical protein